MYKFTNGIVVFDEETKDKYINSGYRLIQDKKQLKKVKKDNEDSFNNGTIQKKPRRSKKVSK